MIANPNPLSEFYGPTGSNYESLQFTCKRNYIEINKNKFNPGFLLDLQERMKNPEKYIQHKEEIDLLNYYCLIDNLFWDDRNLVMSEDEIIHDKHKYMEEIFEKFCHLSYDLYRKEKPKTEFLVLSQSIHDICKFLISYGF